MKKSPLFQMRHRGILLHGLLLGSVLPAMAADYRWDLDTVTGYAVPTTTQQWTTSAVNWDLVGSGLDDGTDALQAVTFTSADRAIFQGTSFTTNRTWSLNTSVSLAGLEFANTGGGTNTLRSTSTTTRIMTLNAAAGLTTSGNATNIGTATQGIQLQMAVNQSWAIGGDTSIFTAITETGGARSLTKTGTGTLIFSAANSYTGATNINEGTLRVSDGGTLGAGAIFIGNVGSSAGTLQYNITTPMTESRVLNLASSSSAPTMSLSSTGSAAITWAGNTSATFTTSRTLRLRGGSTADNTFSGIIANSTGGGTLGVTKADAGKWVLTGANTYTGNTAVNAGTLQIGNGGTAGSLSTSSAISVDGSLIFNRSDTIAQGTNFTASAISGTGSITQAGGGTLVLSAANTYSGGTNVTAGTLRIASGGSTGSGNVTVQTGGTILGTGLVKGGTFTAQSGANVQAGSTTATGDFGTLTFTPVSGSGTFDFASGSQTTLGLNPGGIGDRLVLDGLSGGTLNFQGNLAITAPGYTPVSVETFLLLDWANLTTTNFANRYLTSSYSGYLLGNGDDNLGFDLPDISTSGYGWDISQFTTLGSISTVMIVPEPSRCLLLLAGIVAVVCRRRRFITTDMSASR